MSDPDPSYPELPPAVDDSSKGQHVEEVVHNPPPQYGFNNPPPQYGFNNPMAMRTASPYDVTLTQPHQQAVYKAGVTPTLFAPRQFVRPPVTDIPSYKAWSIVNILFCNLCIGFVACYFSSETEEMTQRGDYIGAANASRNARTANIIATIVGIIAIVLFILYYAKIVNF